MKKSDHTNIIGQDEAKEMLGFKPSTSNSNRKMNELVRNGNIKAYQPSPRVRFYSRESIVDFIMSTKILSDAEFVPVLLN